MKWLRIGLAVFEAVSRVFERIGPVSFESMEKHPPPRHAPQAEAAEGEEYLRDEEAVDESPAGPAAPPSSPDQN